MSIFEEKDGIVKIAGTDDDTLGRLLEYVYVQFKFGIRNRDWQFMSQLLFKKENEWFDQLEIMQKDGKTENIIFNISDFFPSRNKERTNNPLLEPAIPESWGYKNG